MNILDAARLGPNELGAYLASLPREEWESATQTLDAAIAGAAYDLESFKAFARLMMYDPQTQKVTDITAIHEDWAETCLDNNRVCILAPPESAKTTILSILLTAFTIGHKPATMSLVVSVSDDQAQKIVGTITNFIMGHPGWKAVFPDIVPDTKRGWGMDTGFYVRRKGPMDDWMRERGTRNNPTLMGVGYQNRSIIGKRVDGIMVIDDMMDETNTRSEAELEVAKSIFGKTLSSRPTEDGKMIMVGTPWRDDDVYATAVASGLYKNFVTPAWTEVDDENGEKHLVSYWPDVWPIERLERKRIEVGERSFQIMYLMNLEAAKGQILQVNWLEPQFPAEKIETDWPMYYGVDPAISSKDVAPRSSGQRSFFALAKWVVAPFGMILVGGVVARDVGLYKAIEIVKSHAAVDNPRRTGIEIWGAGELFYQQLLKEAPELNLFRVKDTSDKATRFSRMARHFEAGRVKISNAENQFLREFRDEWSGFAPGSRWNTDALDAAFIGLESSGYQVYVGEKLLVPKEKGIIQMEKTPWGPTWGIPGSKFAPSWGAARRRVP